MTKRASGKFKHNTRDFYVTPYKTIVPLLPHVPTQTEFDEPCCGDGDLVRHLESENLICSRATDITQGQDVFDIKQCYGEMFITNPPWSRDILHPLITHLSDIAPTWLLFDADWMHTKQSIPYMKRCVGIVSVGRVSWMDNGVSGFDNCCWYLFGRPHHKESMGDTIFYGRE